MTEDFLGRSRSFLLVVVLLAISVPICASMLDDRIESTARNSYIFQTYLTGDDIKVESKDGVVSLTVSVPLKKTPNIRKKVDDASTTAQIKMALLFHRSTSSLDTKVITNNGVITLYGKAGSTAEKYLVTKIVNDVEGVKRITNRMTIE